MSKKLVHLTYASECPYRFGWGNEAFCHYWLELRDDPLADNEKCICEFLKEEAFPADCPLKDVEEKDD